MAVTLSLSQIAFHCRLTAEPGGDPPFEIAAMLGPLVRWAADEVQLSTTDLCPDSAHNAAVLSLVAYMVDAPPASRHHGNALANSGVPFILRRWLHRRAIELTEFEPVPWPTVEALRADQQVGDWFTPPTGGIAQIMAENAQRGATYEMEARTLVGGSGAPVQTDVHLSIVSQVSNVYLTPAFQYRVTSTGPIGATVWVAFFSRRTA